MLILDNTQQLEEDLAVIVRDTVEGVGRIRYTHLLHKPDKNSARHMRRFAVTE